MGALGREVEILLFSLLGDFRRDDLAQSPGMPCVVSGQASARKVGLARVSPPATPPVVAHWPRSKFERHRPSQSLAHLLDAGSLALAGLFFV